MSLFNLAISEPFKPVLEQVKAFVANEVVPVEEEFYSLTGADGDRWQYTLRQLEILDSLKTKAKALGLWNFFLPREEDGTKITNLDYAYLAEEMGRSHLAAEAFNCSAPDTGNMEVLYKYGSDEQKERWLKPLLNGDIRSCFAMTEPDAACSDAKNVQTSAVLEGDEWVINGEKFYISGAGDPRCKIIICMVKTSPDHVNPNQQQSQILIPMDTQGVEIVGAMHVFGMDDAPHGHMHMRFNNVRVPKDNIILGEGRGFEISQGRLGPGRIHHCMRTLGVAEMALEMMIKRGIERKAFGKELVRLGGNVDLIARARMELDMARLYLLQAACAMDTLPMREARIYVHAIKAVIPEMACRIIDEAIQMHGATGVSQWSPLAHMYMTQRTLRLADGPDEVHRMVVGRNEIAKHLTTNR